MKIIVALSRILVGVLFIISGLIKLNDPLGFSYKLQEYFSTDVLNIPFLEPYALIISVLVVVFEVVLGIFLLLGYKPKFTAWSLLTMIVFFTFLTFYSAYFEKVKDCGCFGDALKLTPWESFTKDVVLLFFVLILFFGVKHITPIFKKLTTTIFALLSFVFSLWFGYHVLMHLPVKDFRAYKIGDNLIDNMSIPEDAPIALQEYTWTFNVDGEEKTFVTNGSYPTVDGEYVGYESKVIREGYEPSILDFSIETNDEDLTQQILGEEHLIMIVSYNLAKAEKEGLNKIKAFSDAAIKKGYKVIGLSASGDEDKQNIKAKYNLNFDFYLCDEKALKTVVRSNPGVLQLNSGTVMQKVHWNDLDQLKVESLPNATPNLNFDLKRQLDSVMVMDQKYRGENYFENRKLQHVIDSTNTLFIEEIFKTYGYPGKSLVGKATQSVAWFVIQHSDKIPDYLPLMKAEAKKGELPFGQVAMMEDRYLMGKGEMQIYGTQGMTYGSGADNSLTFIWPIKDVENVNNRRKEVGYNTVEEYAKDLFGTDFVFRNYTLEEIQAWLKNNN